MTHVPWTPESGLEYLGCPLHPPENFTFVTSFLDQKISQLEKSVNSLKLLRNCQVKFHLLQQCLGNSKLNYLSRASILSYCPSHIEKADSLLKRGLEDILGHTLSPRQWDQACLPIAEGGLGVQPVVHHALPARVSAILDFCKVSQ